VGDFVRWETSDGIGTIRLDRPPVNALNAQVQDEIHAAAREAAADPAARAVVVWGGERAFAAGADIAEMADVSYADMARRVVALQAAFDAVARIPKPVVAAVTGYALGGGCELALACDWRVAADDARFGQPEIRIGVIPGAGGTQRLARLIGPARAKDLIFSGRMVDAAEALRIGLVDRVVPAADVFATAAELVRPYATGPALALAAAKQAIDAGLGMDLPAGLAYEAQLFAAMFATRDQKEGMAAFLAKRPARFRGE
jgi:enoyl-CoA hydratase/carnithine racemase